MNASRMRCGEIAETCLNVVASAAKQSMGQQKERMGLLRYACNDDAERDREVMHSAPPLPPSAEASGRRRMAGRGWGWGLLQQTRCENESANLLHHPPPPTPPHHFAYREAG